MPELLKNLVSGAWVAGNGRGTALLDPVTGAELARVSSDGPDLAAAFSFARSTGGGALRVMTYAQRAALLLVH
jgi:3,4-dehydroadipyl-CoA semialdehyde dehydrogenase